MSSLAKVCASKKLSSTDGNASNSPRKIGWRRRTIDVSLWRQAISRGQVSPTARIAADAKERAMVGFDVNERLGDDSRADCTTRQATSCALELVSQVSHARNLPLIKIASTEPVVARNRGKECHLFLSGPTIT